MAHNIIAEPARKKSRLEDVTEEDKLRRVDTFALNVIVPFLDPRSASMLAATNKIYRKKTGPIQIKVLLGILKLDPKVRAERLLISGYLENGPQLGIWSLRRERRFQKSPEMEIEPLYISHCIFSFLKFQRFGQRLGETYYVAYGPQERCAIMLRGTECIENQLLLSVEAGDDVFDILMDDGSYRRILGCYTLTTFEKVQTFNHRNYVTHEKELMCPPPKVQCELHSVRNWFHSNCFFLTRKYVQTLQSQGVDMEKYWGIGARIYNLYR